MNVKSMNIRDRILDLVQKALDEYDKPNYKLSNIIRKAIRIARLRNDWKNLLWLELEMITYTNIKVRDSIIIPIKFHYSKQEWNILISKTIEEYIESRQVLELEGYKPVSKGRVTVDSISTLEEIAGYMADEAKTPRPEGIPAVDASGEPSYSKYQTAINMLAINKRQILSDIGHRVYEFLSCTEKQLMDGQVLSDIFERNRQYVDDKMTAIAPDILDKFKVVFRRLEERDEEARSQALLTCRRILKSLADKLYPPTGKPVTGGDGKERQLTEEKYINRLWQYISDSVEGTTAGESILSQIEYLGNRIDRVYGLTCKGTHVNVSEEEANQCVIQTYMTIGDILRLAEGDSGIFAKTPDIPLDA